MKTLFTILSTCLMTSMVFPQQNKLTIGIEGGPGFIQFRSNSSMWFNHSTIGYAGALTVQYNLNKVFALRTGLGMDRKGSQTSDINIADDAGKILGVTQFNYYFDYATLPILLRASIGKKVHYFVNVGAYFGYLTRVHYIAKETYGRPNISSGNEMRNYHHFDAGLATGVGLELPIKNKLLLSLELRNNTGLYNIYKVKNNYTLNTRSTIVLIGVAYRFGE